MKDNMIYGKIYGKIPEGSTPDPTHDALDSVLSPFQNGVVPLKKDGKTIGEVFVEGNRIVGRITDASFTMFNLSGHSLSVGRSGKRDGDKIVFDDLGDEVCLNS